MLSFWFVLMLPLRVVRSPSWRKMNCICSVPLADSAPCPRRRTPGPAETPEWKAKDEVRKAPEELLGALGSELDKLLSAHGDLVTTRDSAAGQALNAACDLLAELDTPSAERTHLRRSLVRTQRAEVRRLVVIELRALLQKLAHVPAMAERVLEGRCCRGQPPYPWG